MPVSTPSLLLEILGIDRMEGALQTNSLTGIQHDMKVACFEEIANSLLAVECISICKKISLV